MFFIEYFFKVNIWNIYFLLKYKQIEYNSLKANLGKCVIFKVNLIFKKVR